MISAGIRQHHGEDVGAARVKRQTIRNRGPRARMLFAQARDRNGSSIRYDLHLWWKSRTPQRELLGTVCFPKVWPINILHSQVEPVEGPNYQCIRIVGPRGWRDGAEGLFWSPGDAENGFTRETYADGFDSPEAFRDFFVPNLGDRFDAILFKW